jgi:single-strand DNA-binding protein
MADLNKVFLIGNLTRDPEMRSLSSGTSIASFGLATNRTYTAQNGEKKEEVCFVRVVVFGRQAEACGQYLNKGRPVFVEGRLQYRSWETDGQKRNALDVVAERVQFLGGRSGSTSLTTGGSTPLTTGGEGSSSQSRIEPAEEGIPQEAAETGSQQQEDLPF